MCDISNVFYINLEDRLDRKKHVEEQLNKLGWNYTRFNAIKNKSGRIGCSMSHLKLLQDAKKKELPYVVIIEDDIEFTNVDFFKNQLNTFMKSGINYDVYLLAGNLRRPVRMVKPGILRIYKSFTTTGYIVKKQYFDNMINNIKEGIKNLIKDPDNGLNAIDVYWMRLQQTGNWYISYPRTVTQLPDYSDIEGREVNYNHLMLDRL